MSVDNCCLSRNDH